MNNVFPNKTKRLAVKTATRLFVLVLIALACAATPLTAFACDRPTFATILKGFCQAFKADLIRSYSLSSDQFDEIIQGNSVKGVLEEYKGLNDFEVEMFEKNEINDANNIISDPYGPYAPDACGLQGRNPQEDAREFQNYFTGQEYSGLDIGYIDSMYTDAVRAAGSFTTDATAIGLNSSHSNVVKPTFRKARTTSRGKPCRDTLKQGSTNDPLTSSSFYKLRLGGSPKACHDSVTWNFSGLTVGQDCTFAINPLNQTFTLNFIDSNNRQIDSFTTAPGSTMSRQEVDVKKVELDFSNLSRGTLQLGRMLYSC